MLDTLIIYGKDNCPHTKRAREANPEHVYINVLENEEGLQAMLKLSGGLRRVPVLARRTNHGDELVSVGFNRGS
ncbi:UXX-star selenoprotein family 1 [Oleidesulfovibrio sp.]|uniref:glutaredoxin domain-containing protein n=1 Tax=Oleidesulfovibrio sp. TaxID=2909707 RepID=UPI003A89981F